MKFTYTGKFTSGYYNNMEAGYPVFIDGQSLSDLVKELFRVMELPTNFCDDVNERDRMSDNKLIGTDVTLTLEFKKTG